MPKQQSRSRDDEGGDPDPQARLRPTFRGSGHVGLVDCVDQVGKGADPHKQHEAHERYGADAQAHAEDREAVVILLGGCVRTFGGAGLVGDGGRGGRLLGSHRTAPPRSSAASMPLMT